MKRYDLELPGWDIKKKITNLKNQWAGEIRKAARESKTDVLKSTGREVGYLEGLEKCRNDLVEVIKWLEWSTAYAKLANGPEATGRVSDGRE